MCLFKKKLPKSAKQWNKIWELWSNFELDNPVKDLMTYISEINNGGHLQFFENLENNEEDITIVLNNIKSFLPNELIENLDNAYSTHKSLNTSIETIDDYVAVEMENHFGKYDDILLNQEELINSIIQTEADKL